MEWSAVSRFHYKSKAYADYRCGYCGQVGHNAQRCPTAPTEASNHREVAKKLLASVGLTRDRMLWMRLHMGLVYRAGRDG